MDWTIDDAASNLKVSTKTIRRWVTGNKVVFERRPGKYGDEIHITSIPDDLMSKQSLPTKVQRAEMAVETFADILAAKDKRIEELSQTIGAARLKINQLEEQVKLLKSPQTRQFHWWDRLFHRS